MPLSSSSGDIPANLIDLFAARYRNDQLLSRLMREGRVYALEELLEMGGEDDLRYFEEFLSPLGISHLRAMRLQDESGIDAWLIISASEPIGADVSNLLVALTPHLRAALRVLATLERERARSMISAQAFRRMNFGWISVDAKGRIVDMDDQAETMLRQSSVLRRGPYDRLTPQSPAIDRQLTALLREFSADRRARPRAINLSADPWIDMLVSPVRISGLSSDNTTVAVIYFRSDRTSSSDRQEQLCDLFDLTPTEARLAWSMAQGMTIAEAAEAHGLTIETARNYSKKIYAKTGARGQVDLVRHILTGVLALA